MSIISELRYFYKPMNCELCKTQYATHLKDECPEVTSDGDKRDKEFPLIEYSFSTVDRYNSRPST